MPTPGLRHSGNAASGGRGGDPGCLNSHVFRSPGHRRS